MVDLDSPHEMILSFLERRDPDIREMYFDYKEEKLDPNKNISMTSLDKEDKNPIFPLLLRLEIALQQFENNRIDFMPDQALSGMAFCFFLDVLEGIDIVDPSGDKLYNNLANLYGEEIVNDPISFWDIFFEMEVAHHFVKKGLEAYPIDESAVNAGGADVLYKTADRKFWVECKNKRESTSYEWELERLGREISDSLWNQHNLKSIINEDSFAVQISSDDDISKNIIDDRELRAQLIETLSSSLSNLIENKRYSCEVDFEGAYFQLKLLNYYTGRYKVDVTDEEMEALNTGANLAKVINPLQHLGINPDIIETNGHSKVHAEKSGDNSFDIFSTYAFHLDIPWDIPYQDWIYSTIGSVTDQFTDYQDIIVFVKIPPVIIYKMKNENTINHNEKLVSKWKRLEEKIIGIYDNPDRSNRIKAVVLMTDVIINEVSDGTRNIMQQNAVKQIYNRNVQDDIPDEFIKMIEDMNQIDEYLEKPGIFNLKDQHL